MALVSDFKPATPFLKSKVLLWLVSNILFYLLVFAGYTSSWNTEQALDIQGLCECLFIHIEGKWHLDGLQC